MGFTPGNDSRFSEEKIEAKRNFINKLWNISRFILANIKNTDIDEKSFQVNSLADKWIINSFNKTKELVTNKLENFDFSLAAEELTDFTWNRFADWYLEISKIEENKDKILLYILKNLLIMWHPFIPFVTEKIWSSFNNSLLMIEKWPLNKEISELDDGLVEESFDLIKQIIVSIRNLRTKNKIDFSKKIDLLIIAHEKEEIIKNNIELIKKLKTNIKDVFIIKEGSIPENSIIDIVMGVEVILKVEIDFEKELSRIKKEIDNLNKLIDIQNKKLSNDDFIKKAPEKIVELEKEKLNNYLSEIEKLNNSLN